MKLCPKCASEHDKPGTFCSRSCANSKTWTEADKLKKSIAAKNSIKLRELNIRRGKNRRTNPFGPTTKKQNGGLRQGSGRSKSGYYQGIFCSSLYELVWVIFNLDHSIEFRRCERFFVYDDGRKYFPDFELSDGTIIEIKGYKTETVFRKQEAVINSGLKYKLLFKEDLDDCFKYVESKYSRDFQTLYDNYKPEFSYICDECKCVFSANKKRIHATKFCTKICAGKHVSKLSKHALPN